MLRQPQLISVEVVAYATIHRRCTVHHGVCRFHGFYPGVARSTSKLKNSLLRNRNVEEQLETTKAHTCEDVTFPNILRPSLFKCLEAENF